ncbi:MAG TPA: hypothetical protein PLC52_07790 [Anaerolineales bacterium]|nr:hypothetical protein [Anaerolineales bacterium]HRQ92750.1 hypothetical protein [Anaerolineales bacterium]
MSPIHQALWQRSKAARVCSLRGARTSYGELQRQLQEHAAQLKLFLGQQTGCPSHYVTRAEM